MPATAQPDAELDTRFSMPEASAIDWAEARDTLAAAGIFWISTVRADGRPHVTLLIGVWDDGALYFCTGPGEQKAHNLARNPHCILTTGCNAMDEGLDIVVEGVAAEVGEEAKLRHLADAYVAKYGSDWRFDVRDGAFNGEGGNVALVFEVAPSTAFGFVKGASSSQTRWRF